MIAQAHLELGPRPTWTRIDVEDPRGRDLADRHYSRQARQRRALVPEDRVAPLQGADRVEVADHAPERRARLAPRSRAAAFVVPQREAQAGRHVAACADGLLVETATEATYAVWLARYRVFPPVPLRTEVDVEATRRRRSKRHEPGHCYRVAGWREVARLAPGHGRPERVILEAPAP